MQRMQHGTTKRLWRTIRTTYSAGGQPAGVSQTHAPGVKHTSMRTALLWTMALGLALTMTTSSLARPGSAERVEHAPLVLVEDDSDNDGITDIIEALEQTDPLDPEDSPGRPAARERPQSGVPTSSCDFSERLIDNVMCISSAPFSARSFSRAVLTCTSSKARVATYGDLFFLYKSGSVPVGSYDPLGRWIGPELVGDNQALCGNRAITSPFDPDIENFEGTCNKLINREFWCVRDRK
jgi:hypothetical protein